MKAFYRIEVVQLQGTVYFWGLFRNEIRVAQSSRIEDKNHIIEEANMIAEELQLPEITISER